MFPIRRPPLPPCRLPRSAAPAAIAAAESVPILLLPRYTFLFSQNDGSMTPSQIESENRLKSTVIDSQCVAPPPPPINRSCRLLLPTSAAATAASPRPLQFHFPLFFLFKFQVLKFDSEYIFLNFPFSQNGTLPSQWFHPAGRRRRRRRCRCLNSILHLSFFRKYDPPGPSTFPSRSPTTADAAARNPPDVRARSQQQPSPISSSMDYEGDGAAVASPGPPG